MWIKETQRPLYETTDLFLPWGDFAAFMLGLAIAAARLAAGGREAELRG
jgi:hypothetical protein